MLKEPLGELRKVREVARNAMKLEDRNTFSIIFLTVRPAPRGAVKQACKVQDQWKSKCCFSCPACMPSPWTLLPCLFTAAPRGSVSHTIALWCCLFFENGLSCETQRKHSNTNWYLILKNSPSLAAMRLKSGSWGLAVSEDFGVKGGFLTGSGVSLRGENQTGDSWKHWVAFNLAPSRFYLELASSSVIGWVIIYTELVIMPQIGDFPPDRLLLLPRQRCSDVFLPDISLVIGLWSLFSCFFLLLFVLSFHWWNYFPATSLKLLTFSFLNSSIFTSRKMIFLNQNFTRF